MTEREQEEARKVVQLSILVPFTKERFYVFNNLYNELRRQIDLGGYLGKGELTWDHESPRLDDEGNPELSEHGTPIIDVLTQRFIHPDLVEIVLDKSDKSIGEKRNNLLKKALGKYVCFIDSDDWVSEDYIQTVMEAIQSDPDCLSLRGEMTTDGQNPEIFEHSLKYSKWRTTNNKIKYERYPNHLNIIRASIAKQFNFPDSSWGEDHQWSTLVHNSKLLKTEVYIDKILYHYRFKNKVLA